MCGWNLGLSNVSIFVLCTDVCAFRTILFTPFVPFIVMFCHTIEKRDKGDLSRMYAFLKSIECACQHSNAIAKYHHLFGVLYSVALRYTELGLPSSRMEEEQSQLLEVDAHLSALGLQPHTTYLTAHHTEDVDSLMSSVQPSVEAIEQNRTTEGNNWAEEPWLGRWFSFNQQMMGLFKRYWIFAVSCNFNILSLCNC